MKKKESSKLSEDGRLPDGSMRFVVKLPKQVADLFEAEMKIEDRKKLPMARHIIALYFRDRSLRKEFDEFIQHRGTKTGPGPHFEDEPHLPHVSALRKGLR